MTRQEYSYHKSSIKTPGGLFNFRPREWGLIRDGDLMERGSLPVFQIFKHVILKELCHGVFIHFSDRQNFLIEGSLKIIVS